MTNGATEPVRYAQTDASSGSGIVIDLRAQTLPLLGDEAVFIEPQARLHFYSLKLAVGHEEERRLFEGTSVDPVGASGRADSDTAIRQQLPVGEDRDELINTIEALAKLDEDWDGYGSIGPTRDTIESTKHLIRELPEDCELPRISLCGEGELTLVWEALNGKVLLTVEDRVLHLLVKRKKGRNFYLDNVSYASGAIPQNILRRIPIV